jgi:hypothetical protein
MGRPRSPTSPLYRPDVWEAHVWSVPLLVPADWRRGRALLHGYERPSVNIFSGELWLI